MTLTAWLLVFGGLTVTAIVIDGLRLRCPAIILVAHKLDKFLKIFSNI